jgi:hypothetical protein
MLKKYIYKVKGTMTVMSETLGDADKKLSKWLETAPNYIDTTEFIEVLGLENGKWITIQEEE